jgi:hypothetical protein
MPKLAFPCFMLPTHAVPGALRMSRVPVTIVLEAT